MAQLSGKIQEFLPMVEGETARGRWVRAGFVIASGDYQDRYVALSLFGEDRVKWLDTLRVGQTVVVEYVPESRKVNERWFTDLKCLKVMIAS